MWMLIDDDDDDDDDDHKLRRSNGSNVTYKCQYSVPRTRRPHPSYLLPDRSEFMEHAMTPCLTVPLRAD